MQQQAQQYDMFGKRMAADQAAQQQQMIEAQGRASAMPAEAQSRGVIGAAEQNAKAAQAGLQAQREMTAEQNQLNRENTANLQKQRITEAAVQKDESILTRELNDLSAAAMTGDTASLSAMVSISKTVGKTSSPMIKGILEAKLISTITPIVESIAKPSATKAEKAAIYQALIDANGNVNSVYSNATVAKLLNPANK
jgi:hypothetical protein